MKPKDWGDELDDVSERVKKSPALNRTAENNGQHLLFLKRNGHQIKSKRRHTKGENATTTTTTTVVVTARGRSWLPLSAAVNAALHTERQRWRAMETSSCVPVVNRPRSSLPALVCLFPPPPVHVITWFLFFSNISDFGTTVGSLSWSLGGETSTDHKLSPL